MNTYDFAKQKNDIKIRFGNLAVNIYCKIIKNLQKLEKGDDAYIRICEDGHTWNLVNQEKMAKHVGAHRRGVQNALHILVDGGVLERKKFGTQMGYKLASETHSQTHSENVVIHSQNVRLNDDQNVHSTVHIFSENETHSEISKTPYLDTISGDTVCVSETHSQPVDNTHTEMRTETHSRTHSGDHKKGIIFLSENGLQNTTDALEDVMASVKQSYKDKLISHQKYLQIVEKIGNLAELAHEAFQDENDPQKEVSERTLERTVSVRLERTVERTVEDSQTHSQTHSECAFTHYTDIVPSSSLRSSEGVVRKDQGNNFSGADERAREAEEGSRLGLTPSPSLHSPSASGVKEEPPPGPTTPPTISTGRISGRVEATIIASRESDGTKWARRCIGHAMDEKDYMAWLFKARMSYDHRQGLTMVFDTWFKADQVAQRFGYAISKSMIPMGQCAIRCLGPQDKRHAADQRPRHWIRWTDDEPTGGTPETNAAWADIVKGLKTRSAERRLQGRGDTAPKHVDSLRVKGGYIENPKTLVDT